MGRYKELIDEYIDIIEKLNKILELKHELGRMDEESINFINELIEYFIGIVNLIDEYITNDKELEYIVNDISNIFVSIVDHINNKDIDEGLKLLETIINKKMNIFTDVLRRKLKYKIVIYGINDISLKLSEMIDYNKSEVLFYTSDNLEYLGKTLNGSYIISLEEVVKYNYDYLLVADNDISQLNMMIDNGKVDKEQIVNCLYYLYNFGFYGSPEFHIQYNNFKKSDKRYEGIITGISYTQKGIDAELLKYRFFNLACASQDLFYDYEMMKYALGIAEVKNNIRYAIIGLCHYSFQYDLSKGIGKNRSNYYYTVTEQYHNYDQSELNIVFYRNIKDKFKKILKDGHDEILWELLEKDYMKIIEDGREKEFDSKSLSHVELEDCIKEVKRKHDKEYPISVKENIDIFKKYLNMLYKNNIKVIVVVPPQTDIYRENASGVIMDEFYKIINEFRVKYDFQFLDYFYSEDFIDSDFYDFCHLNKKGSRKLTELLNENIMW